MRDQSTQTVAPTSNVLDFLNDENAEITLDKLMETVKKITQPSSDIINPTLDTGSNTSKFLLLLSHLEAANKAATLATTKGVLEAITARYKVDSITRKAHNDGEVLTPEQTTAHETARQLHNAQMQLWGRVAAGVREAGQHIDTLSKVSRSLLALQESVGRAIRSDRTALAKLTVAIKLLDGQWGALKQRYVLVAALEGEIAELAERLGATVWVRVTDRETGEEKMVKVDVAGLSLGFLESQEGAGDDDDEEEDSDESRVVDLDEESEGEELVVGALLEGEVGVVSAGEVEVVEVAAGVFPEGKVAVVVAGDDNED